MRPDTERDPEDTAEDEGITEDSEVTEQARGRHAADPERDDPAETPGSSRVDHEHADELADEWGEESFPASDPPAHY